MTAHVFNCTGSETKHGITQDKTGSNLPKDRCNGEWKYRKTITLELGKPLLGLNVSGVIDLINKDGFAIVDVSVNFNIVDNEK